MWIQRQWPITYTSNPNLSGRVKGKNYITAQKCRNSYKQLQEIKQWIIKFCIWPFDNYKQLASQFPNSELSIPWFTTCLGSGHVCKYQSPSVNKFCLDLRVLNSVWQRFLVFVWKFTSTFMVPFPPDQMGSPLKVKLKNMIEIWQLKLVCN